MYVDFDIGSTEYRAHGVFHARRPSARPSAQLLGLSTLPGDLGTRLSEGLRSLRHKTRNLPSAEVFAPPACTVPRSSRRKRRKKDQPAATRNPERPIPGEYGLGRRERTRAPEPGWRRSSVDLTSPRKDRVEIQARRGLFRSRSSVLRAKRQPVPRSCRNPSEYRGIIPHDMYDRSTERNTAPWRTA
jgi:hypothetical protein